MPARGKCREKHVAGDKSHPRSLGKLLRKYLESLDLRNFSKETIKKRRLQLNSFVEWCEGRQLMRVTEISRIELEHYQEELPRELDVTGKPRTIRNQHERLMSIRSWFRWMTRKRYLLHNPASEIDLPKLGQRLPGRVLNPSQVESILAAVDLESSLGPRDRSILETFYSTGVRRMELVHLKLADIDEERGVMTVRQGKGKRDRVVPVGDRAMRWLDQYIKASRPQSIVNPDEMTVYLTRLGTAFSGSSLSALVNGYVRKSGVANEGSCHLFRHAMATAMHDAGADIRYVQAMLGHVKLETTQIYTHVSIQKLKAIHRQTHPAS